MIKILLLFPIISLSVSFTVILIIANSYHIDLYKFYSNKLQTPLFTGFLTIGGFLLSLKTFILIKLKEDLYGLDSYRKRMNTMRAINPKLTFYGPLSRLSSFLVFCVLGALLTSMTQFTIGFFPSDYIAAFCMSVAISTLSLVLLVWWEIRKNLKDWFELLEESEKLKTSPPPDQKNEQS